jgi:hypothetical protein
MMDVGVEASHYGEKLKVHRVLPRHLTRQVADLDEDMRSEMSDDDLPTLPTVVEMLLDAPTSLNTGRKRSASCPPKLNDNSLDDLVAKFEDLSMVLPHSDPIDTSATPRVPRKEVKRRAEEQGVNGITVENAQTLLDPDACLFVAK